jgi:cohesin complex subunit SA-1/2
MSSSALRPFRHTATTIALAVQSGLVEVAQTLDRRIANIEQQLQAAKKGKNKSKTAEVQRSLTEATSYRKICGEAIQSYFDTVFVHRYRDVDPKIRTECVEALGSWIWNLPTIFLEPGYLRYLGWMLSDTNATTRHEVLKQLARVFKRDASQLGHFIDRFRPRLVEMATLDSELSVRVAAISVIDTLRESALLEPKEIDAIGKLIFDNELRIRKAVAGFFIACVGDVYEGKVEKIGASDYLDELESAEEEAEDFSSPRKEWLNIKCLAETLASYDAQVQQDQQEVSVLGPDAAVDLLESGIPETRISLAAQVLYDRVPEVKRWEMLTGYLLFDHTTSTKAKPRTKNKPDSQEAAFKKAVAPTAAEESILLDVLSSAIKSSLSQAEELERHKKKGHRTEASEAQEEIALELASAIPRLLNKFGAEPETAATVLRMEHLLNLEIFQQLRQDSSKFEKLLDEVSTQFDRHDDKRVLAEAAAALLHARQYDELEEIVDSKLSLLWENVINALRNFDKTYELSTRGNLEEASLRDLSTILTKISKLASVADCVDVLEAEGTSDDSSSSTIEILSNIVHRGKYEPLEDEIDDLEDEVVSFSIKSCQFYFMWKVRAMSKLLRSGAGISDAELDRLAVLRQNYRRHLIETLSSRAAIDQLRLFATGSLCDLHLTFATLRPAIDAFRPASGSASADAQTAKYKALVQEIEPGLVPELISIYDGVEKHYAKKAHKDKTLNEPAENEDPMSDEDEEDADEDDEDQSLTKEERYAIELKAEKALCELTAKYVLSIGAKLLDQRGTQAGKIRRRLLRNQTKLGHNFKEIVSYLDEEKLAGHTKKPIKPAAITQRPQKAALSAETVHDEDDEDENEQNPFEDEPEPEEGSREDLRRRELLDEEPPEEPEEPDEDENQADNDDDDVLGD